MMKNTRNSAKQFNAIANSQQHTLAPPSLPSTPEAKYHSDDFDLEGLSTELKIVVNANTLRFNKRLDEKDKRIEKLEEIVMTLSGRLVKQEEVIEKQGEIIESLQQERIMGTMVISGNIPPYNINEDCSEVVANTLREKLNTMIRPSDIIAATRMGAPKPLDVADKRPIKFKFKTGNIDLRKNVQIACVTVRPNIFINELTTPLKKDLLNQVKKIKKDAPGVIRSCYVSNGRVVIKRPDGRNIKISNQKELNQYLQDINIPVPSENQTT